MKLKATQTFQETLKQALAESARVTVHLKGSVVLEGLVGEVGDDLVVITNLTRKEFFDGMARIDSILAIETRARNS
jgi:hypothetical protein